ncbi:MAG: hypothetical protein AAF125_23050, partial [Chloroflexota bacterium]
MKRLVLIIALSLATLWAQAQPPDETITAGNANQLQPLWSLEPEGKPGNFVWGPGDVLAVEKLTGVFAYTAPDWNTPTLLTDQPVQLVGYDDNGTLYAFGPVGEGFPQQFPLVRVEADGSLTELITPEATDEVVQDFGLGNYAAIAPDGSLAAYAECTEGSEGSMSVSCSNYAMRVVDLATGNVLWRLDSVGVGGPILPHAPLVFDRSGERLMVPKGIGYNAYDAQTGDLIYELLPPADDSAENEHLSTVVLSPDGTQWLTGGDRFMTWDVETGENLWTGEPHYDVPGPYATALDFAWTPTGNVVVARDTGFLIQTFPSDDPPRDEFGSNAVFADVPGISDWVWQITLSPSGDYFAAGDDREVIVVWDTAAD